MVVALIGRFSGEKIVSLLEKVSSILGFTMSESVLSEEEEEKKEEERKKRKRRRKRKRRKISWSCGRKQYYFSGNRRPSLIIEILFQIGFLIKYPDF